MTLRQEVRRYRRATNMDVGDLRRWKQSQAFKEYVRRSSGDPVEAVRRNIRLQRKIRDGTISEADLSDLEKANSFLARMKEEDSGPQVVGRGRVAVSKRTAALRSWAFDPTGRFT